MGYLFGGVAFLLVIFGCTTATHHDDLWSDLPPAYDSEQHRKLVEDSHPIPENLPHGLYNLLSYLQARHHEQKSPELACDNFLRLAQDEDFPLARIASLRAYLSCPQERAQADFAWNPESADLNSWMKPLWDDVYLKKSQQTGDLEKLYELQLGQSKRHVIQKIKVDWTNKAMETAKQLGDKDKVQAMQKRLWKLAPRLNPNPSRKDFLAVASDFRNQRQFDTARAYYRKVIQDRKQSFSNRVSAYYGFRKTYKLERNYKRYVEVTEEMAKFVGKQFRRKKRSRYYTRRYHEVLLQLARTQWTYDTTTAARETLKLARKTLKKRYPLDRVYWIEGRMAEEKGRFDQALWWFNEALKEVNPKSNFHSNLHWYAAWNARKLKKVDQATKHFQAALENAEDDFDRARIEFWMGLSFLDANDTESAHNHFASAVEKAPFSYYGLLSRQKLPGEEADRGLASLDEAFGNKDRHPALEFQKLYREFDPLTYSWLSVTDEDELLNKYLSQFWKNKRLYRETRLKRLHSYFRLYQNSKLYQQMFIKLHSLPESVKNRLVINNPDYLFPRPFHSIVKESEDKFGVETSLIYAIMRQESAFNRRARSHADAFGLMQLLPSVAKRTANVFDLEFDEAEDLFQPEIAIPIGTAHVKELFDRYRGQFILSVASYNASSEAIRGWVKTRYRGDPLEFIEDIPYAETRSYVRLVLRNYIFYRWLESDGASLRIPASTLELKVDDAVAAQ